MPTKCPTWTELWPGAVPRGTLIAGTLWPGREEDGPGCLGRRGRLHSLTTFEQYHVSPAEPKKIKKFKLINLVKSYKKIFLREKEEGNVLFNDALNAFYFTVIWRRTYGKGPHR